MNEYDIVKIFRDMETDLINSMMRNLKRHLKDEDLQDINWTQWQTEMLQGLQDYRKRNKEIIQRYDKRTISNLETLLRTTYKEATLEQEREILENIIKGAKVDPSDEIKKKLEKVEGETIKEKASKILETEGSFFKINDKKLNALIKESTKPLKDSNKSILRYQDDVYRQIIFKSQVYSNTGVKTLYQCIDMATKDFLDRGITNITYKNGKKVSIDSYAELCIRNANKKAKLQGEADVRDEWNEFLVIVNQYGAASPTCLPWQGKVYIDDVYSNGKPDGKHELLSTAVAAGLYHPNCRHHHSTWFEGVSRKPAPLDNAKVSEHSKLESIQRYNERQIRKYERLKNNSLDPGNKSKYEKKWKEWQTKNREFVKTHEDVLVRDYWREKNRIK